MSLLKQTFEQLKIALKNDAKTKPSILDISQSPIECGLASNKTQFRSKMIDSGSISFAPEV